MEFANSQINMGRRKKGYLQRFGKIAIASFCSGRFVQDDEGEDKLAPANLGFIRSRYK
jgi:hypothetical protein